MTYERIKNSKIIKGICTFQSSNAYIYVLCAFAVLSNVFALDGFLFAPILVSLCITNLFSDDVLPALPVAFTIAFGISPEHSPARGDTSYYLSVPFLCVIAPLVFAVAATAFFRASIDKNYKKISFSRGLALGIVVYSAVLLLNGIFSPEHDVLDFACGALTVATLTPFYFFFAAALNDKDINYEYICKTMVASGVVALIELFAIYVKNFGSLTSLDSSWKNMLYSGWGISNTIGQYVAMMIPSCFYFAVKKEKILTSFFLAGALYAGTYFSLCRTGMLIGAFICAVCAVITCVCCKNKKKSIICTVIFGAILIAVYAVTFFGTIFPEFFGFVRGTGVSDRGRFALWQKALEIFAERPLFGAGFNSYARQTGGFSVAFAHNTLIQMLASCGVIGFAAYCYHRAQTVKLCLHKPTPVRLLIITEIAAYLLMGLLDITCFTPYCNMVYAALLAFLEKESLTDLQYKSTFLTGKKR